MTGTWHSHRPVSMLVNARRAAFPRRFGSVKCQTRACVSATTTVVTLTEATAQGARQRPADTLEVRHGRYPSPTKHAGQRARLTRGAVARRQPGFQGADDQSLDLLGQ